MKKAKDWSYLILIILFGCVYIMVFGVPLPGGRTQAQEPKAPETAERFESEQPEGAVSGTAGNGQEALAQEQEDGRGDADRQTDVPEEAEAGSAGTAGQDRDESGIPAEDTEDVPAEEVRYQTVEDDYFADAVFIGDSRTVGMYEYGGLEEISTFCCSTGLTVYKMFDAKIVKTPGSKEKLTVEEVLSQRQFSAVYLMIGINEMGTGTVDSFIEAYRSCVERLQELQPDAVIYLQGIIRVTEERSAKGDYITNEGIDARNEEIAKLADNQRIFYLDVNPLICDESGGMIESYTYDGVHLKAKYIAVWKEYLMNHAVAASFD